MPFPAKLRAPRVGDEQVDLFRPYEVVIGFAAELGAVFYAFLAAGFAQLLWQAKTGRFDDAADCLAKFKSNRLFGWLLLAGIVLGGL